MADRGDGSPCPLMAQLRTRRELLRGAFAASAAAPTKASTTAPAAAPTTAAAAPTTAAAAAPTAAAAATPAQAAPTTAPAAGGGVVTVGSNYSDPVPKKAMQAVFDAFTQ